MSLQTPVVFLIFNRPDLTQQVFQVIRQVQPKRLFVVADGPRDDAEAAVCQATRAIVEAQIDWDAQVERDYAEVNLGCRRRVASGLNWVFAQTDRAIILEDDCWPEVSFFRFCEALLARYQDDERVMAINGTNYQQGRSVTPYSYYFSKYFHCWGWATWARAWRYYDVEMKQWPAFRDGGYLRWVSEDEYEYRYWWRTFERMYRGEIDTWDYPFLLACFCQNGLAATPRVNLVSNLGFGVKATHTHNPHHRLARMPTQALPEITHPPFLTRHRDADRWVFDWVFGGRELRNRDTWPGRWRAFKTHLRRWLTWKETQSHASRRD
ncbi:MAG: hypothetical protein RMI89_00860 [Gloeomargarita sp. SKYBB_i_bin120]|nr:hypothetical protein [Gloeomargarita sp. SKYG98]MCS7291511.1 hypothetical protein [Gloeomargarita sp. SKYB120]MDW8177071.1 hypothetical protein [Gloeomargarita sp. SKYBB_i_bin120]